MCSSYVLGERSTFRYYIDDYTAQREIVYYKGQLIWGVGYVEDVSFVCFDDSESASKSFKSSLRVNDHKVLRARHPAYDTGIKQHIVCFDRFDGFLTEVDPTFVSRLQDPNTSNSVPGHPNVDVQNEVKQMIEGLEHMHSKGVSTSMLHLPVAYVWSSGTPKIIMLEVTDSKDHTSEQWNSIRARDVERFGIGLDKYFLKTNVVWPEKVSFMRCFSMRVQDESRRLRMILKHPFLKKDLYDILKIFTRVHRALRHWDHGELQLTKLMAALNSKQFKSEFMPDGEWTRHEMSPQFNAFLRGDPQGDSIKYNTRDMGDLLRCLRNMFEGSMSEYFIFNEVRRYWPHLIDRFYEKMSRW